MTISEDIISGIPMLPCTFQAIIPYVLSVWGGSTTGVPAVVCPPYPIMHFMGTLGVLAYTHGFPRGVDGKTRCSGWRREKAAEGGTSATDSFL